MEKSEQENRPEPRKVSIPPVCDWWWSIFFDWLEISYFAFGQAAKVVSDRQVSFLESKSSIAQIAAKETEGMVREAWLHSALYETKNGIKQSTTNEAKAELYTALEVVLKELARLNGCSHEMLKEAVEAGQNAHRFYKRVGDKRRAAISAYNFGNVARELLNSGETSYRDIAITGLSIFLRHWNETKEPKLAGVYKDADSKIAELCGRQQSHQESRRATRRVIKIYE